MMSLQVMVVILAALVAFDHIDKTSAGWLRVRVLIWKKGLDLQCPEWYGVACEKAEAVLGNGDKAEYSGTGCKMSPKKYCASQKHALSSTTDEGLHYVPLPPRFDYYDIDGDHKITFEEFSSQILARFQIQDPMTLKTMFVAADVNGDGNLEPDEFSTAPFIQTSVSGIKEVNGRNAVEEESENQPSQTSENEP